MSHLHDTKQKRREREAVCVQEQQLEPEFFLMTR